MSVFCARVLELVPEISEYAKTHKLKETAKQFKISRETMRKLVVDGVVAKPIPRTALAARIEALLPEIRDYAKENCAAAIRDKFDISLSTVFSLVRRGLIPEPPIGKAGPEIRLKPAREPYVPKPLNWGKLMSKGYQRGDMVG
jgi:hypothetical protein